MVLDFGWVELSKLNFRRPLETAWRLDFNKRMHGTDPKKNPFTPKTFAIGSEKPRVRTMPPDSIFINKNWISFLREMKMGFLSHCQIMSCKSCTTVIQMRTRDWLVRLCSHSEGQSGIEVENWLRGQFQKLFNMLEFGFWFASELNQIGTAFWLSWIIEIEFLKSAWNRMKIGFQKGHGTDP